MIKMVPLSPKLISWMCPCVFFSPTWMRESCLSNHTDRRSCPLSPSQYKFSVIRLGLVALAWQQIPSIAKALRRQWQDHIDARLHIHNTLRLVNLVEREKQRERETKWKDKVTAKSKRFWQNLRMMKLKDDRKLSKEVWKEEGGKIMKGPGWRAELKHDRVRPKRWKNDWLAGRVMEREEKEGGRWNGERGR